MKEKGQALVETAIVMSLIMVPLLMAIVAFSPLIFDWFAVNDAAEKGARAGSIYYADGVHNCRASVLDAIGDPPLLFATYTVDVSDNCDYAPQTNIAVGDPIEVTIHVVYESSFLGGWGLHKDHVTPLVFDAYQTEDHR